MKKITNGRVTDKSFENLSMKEINQKQVIIVTDMWIENQIKFISTLKSNKIYNLLKEYLVDIKGIHYLLQILTPKNFKKMKIHINTQIRNGRYPIPIGEIICDLFPNTRVIGYSNYDETENYYIDINNMPYTPELLCLIKENLINQINSFIKEYTKLKKAINE